MAEDKNVEKIDLIPLIRLGLKQLLHTWILGLLLVGITGGLGYFRTSRSYSPSYSIKASFVVNSTNGELTNSAYYDKVTAEQLNQTFPYILTSGALSEIVANDLGVTSIPGSISASSLGETNLFQIRVSGKDPEEIGRVLDSVIENYPEVSKYVIGTTQLKLLEKEPIPTQPDNPPDYKRVVVKYGMVGAILYLAYLAFLVLTNRTVRSKRMLYKYINISNMGSIPKVKAPKRRRKKPILVSEEGVNSQYLEAMGAVRSRIDSKMTKRNMKAIYVTSSLAGEGKTTTACNLAILMAQHGSKVILIDADLRNPSVSKTLQLKNEKGLVDILLADVKAGEAGGIKESELVIETDIPNLTVIPGGKPVGKVRDAFTNGHFKELIQKCKKKYDVIIVDTPPCAFIHDTAMIAPHLDGGFMVIRQDYVPIDRVVAGTDLLSKTSAPLIGCALNFSDHTGKRYGYGYK